MAKLSYGRVLTDVALRDGIRTSVVCEDEVLTRAELESRGNRLARVYQANGVRRGDLVTSALPNSLELVVHIVAAWKCGAVPNPLSYRLPAGERAAIVEHAKPALCVGFDAEGYAALPAGFEPPAELSDAALPDITSPHERALASGGSTGHPKLIVVRSAAEFDPDAPRSPIAAAGCVLIPGPLYHAAPIGSLTQTLLAGETAVIMERFDAARCLQLIERHRVEQVLFVPTMMHRIWRLPEEERRSFDVSSLRIVFSGGAPLPPWLMWAWIDWLGPDVMHEVFGPSERIGGTHINGREWLDHPGSVGRPVGGAQIRILDPDTGRELPPGEVGEIYMMPAGGPGSTYRYVGAEAHTTSDGWESVGDMGRLDEDGYLYLADRRTDMILCGGRNIYPAQVEAAIDAYPDVESSAVIGLPDEDLGQRVHAIVQAPKSLDETGLRAHLADQIARYAIPRSFEFVDYPLRDDAGKVKRFALRNERIEGRK
jgi:bile acid-coenzyme A ligase